MNDRQLLILSQTGPCRHFHNKGKAICQRGIQWLTTHIALVAVIGADRVHGGPTVSQAIQRQALHLALVDDGEELVLDVGATAADLVEDHCASAPDSRRSLDVFEAAVFPGYGKTDQVIKVEQAGVVVTKIQAQCCGDLGQQQAFGRAVRSYQQQRLFGCQGGN